MTAHLTYKPLTFTSPYKRQRTYKRRKGEYMDRTILHSDCNCFYASVELLHHPELRGKPVAVGGNPEARHGIVLTADYTAKQFGVKTGMALWKARQACPDIVFLPPRMDLYLRFSKMLRRYIQSIRIKLSRSGLTSPGLMCLKVSA